MSSHRSKAFSKQEGPEMNYAEDRLDRRARMLNQGYSCDDKDWGHTSLSNDLSYAHSLIREALFSNRTHQEAIQLSKSGHELAGRTLRDCGLCSQASFHYAMAWMCDVSDMDRAGDYAQMAEFCGRPDMGIYSLLFYRSGGTFRTNFFQYSASLWKDSEGTNCDDKPEAIWHCGCNMKPCGGDEFFVPHDMEFSDILLSIVQSFHDLVVMKRQATTSQPSSAYNILELISGLKKNGTNSKWKVCDIHDVTDTVLRHIRFDILRFWEMVMLDAQGDDSVDVNSNLSSPHSSQYGVSDGVNVNRHSIGPEVGHSEDSNMPEKTAVGVGRNLSPLIQLLLLKLLYVTPLGGPYLYLACEATPHLSALFHRSSNLSQYMAEKYKSHWAYFIFIQYAVLGERMKKHRRIQTPYHMPTWDVVHDIDSRHDHIHESYECDSEELINDHPTLYVRKPLDSAICSSVSTKRLRPLFAVGDSHVISIGWQTIHILSHSLDELRFIVPVPITGLKAWHVRDGTKFFTHYNLHKTLQQLPSSCHTIILSAGEIDCREGIGGERLEGYEDDCTDEVLRTVKEYVLAVSSLSKRYNLQILLMPVAPHAGRSDKNGRKVGRAMRRERMKCWNDTLRKECSAIDASVFLLDYEESLRFPDKSSPVGFVLNPVYNADYTHMNNSFLPLMEEAIINCGCVLQLL